MLAFAVSLVFSMSPSTAAAQCGGCPTSLVSGTDQRNDAKEVQRGKAAGFLLGRHAEVKGLDLRFDSFVMTAHAARSYAFATGKLPGSLGDLRDYLFFEPTCEFSNWVVEGDCLRFNAEVFDLEPRCLEAKIVCPRTAAWREEEEQRRQARFRAFHDRPVEPRIADVSAEDVLAGRFSDYIVDKLRAFSASDPEFLQLYWSWQIAGFLQAALCEFNMVNGRYPQSAEEMLASLPARNEAAWVAPLTGQRVDFTDSDDGGGIVYRPVDDGAGFELLVPLFGAGAEHALGGNKHRFSRGDGYAAGKYFRRAAGTDADTPLTYGT